MKRRMFSLLTALALVLSLCPAGALAAGEPADAGLCDHHPAHTAECGYTAPTGGQPCGHEHGDECYSEETRCVHVHGESCYSDGLLPAEGEDKAADACAHTCSAESGCVTRTLDCQHSHDGACGYVQADPGTPCGYGCRICPVEELIAALPEKVTEENRADVEARLQEILALLEELPEEQQDLVDITPCLALQEQLDAAGAASPLAEGDGTEGNPWLCGAEGDNLTAVLDGNTLTISGTGDMADYTTYIDTPWNNKRNQIQSVVLPEGLTTIGNNAFSSAMYLRNVTIPGTVTSIGEDAFSDSGLTGVTIPEGVVTIGGDAFYSTKLESVTIPASVTVIGISAFNGTLNTVIFQGRKAPTVGKNAFKSWDEFKTVSVPHGCKAAYQTALADSGIPNLGSIITAPAEHEWNDDGSCACGAQAVAVRRIFGNTTTTTFLENAEELINAFTPDERALPVDISLLKAVELSRPITIRGSEFGQFRLSGGNWPITYIGNGAALRIESGNVTLSTCKIDGKQYGVEVSDGTVKLSGCAITAAGDGYSGGQGVYILGGDVTISGGTYSGTGGDAACGVEIHGGMLTIESGTFSGAGGYNACGVKVADSGKAAIRDGSFSGTDGYDASGLRVLAGNAVISGGVFTGSYYGVYNTGGTTISGGTFSGEWHPLDTNASLAGMLATGCAYYRDDRPIEADNGLSPGTVTVRECDHTGVEVKDLGSGKHGLTCPYCGGGYSHETVLTAAASGSLVTLTLGCRTGDCGYKESLGSMTFTIPSVFYGETGKELTWTPVPGDYYLALELTGSQAQILPPTKTSITMGELFGSTKMTPGSYQLQVGCFYSGHMEACKLPITVEKAPLTPSITGTATKPYDGTTAAPEGLEIALTGLVEGDNVTASASFAYNSENVNEANAITATNITLGGADAGSYRLTSDSASIEGTITKADQAAPAAPAAAEDNIKDTSITLNTIANAEYSKDGDTWQASPTFTGLDPNRAYTFYARLKGDGNHNASTNSPGASITTRKMMLDNATVTVGGSYTYTGAAQTPAVAVVKNGKTLTAGTDYTVSYANNTNAGTATVTITGMGDYEGTNSTTFTIRQKPLTATGAAAQNRAYDGTNTVTITGVMLEGVVDGDQVSVSTAGLTGTLGGTDAGAYTAVTLPALTLTGGGADNYTLTRPAGAVSTSVTISKAAARTPKTGDLAVANKQAHTYTFGLGALRPDLPAGMSFGSSAVTYELGAVSLGSYYGGSGAKIEGQTLTLPIEAVGNDKAQGIGTITVIIHTGNFEDMTATINVRSVNKIIPEGAPALSADVLTYGQSLDTIMLSGAMRDGEKTVPGTFAWSSPGNRPAVQEAYAAAWVFTPDDNDTYAIVNGTSVIRVAPASIAGAVITLDPSVFRYDGQPHSPNISSVRLGGVTLTAGADYTAGVPAETEAGTYTVTVTGRGNYTGTAEVTFTINPVAQKPLDQKDDSGRDLRLEVETGLSAVPDALKTNPKYDTPEKIEEELRTRVRAVMTGAGENIEVFDVTLQYKDAGGVWHDVDPNDFPAEGVTAILPYPDGTGMTGWRFTVQHLISSGGDAGEMETLAHTLTADGLQCTFTSLSPVAIGYQAASNPTPRPVPGGGSDDRDDTCAVTVERPVHGKVTASPGSAGRGDTVTLTVTPDSGYVLDTLTVTDRRGNEIGLTARDGGKYAFTMPGRAVTVRAVFVPVQAGWSNPYSDVAPDAWCYEAVRFVTENGLMSGYGNGGSPAGGVFGPNRILTRAQFAQILHNREGRPAVNYLMRFEDVPGEAWCAEAIRWAASQGIVGGYGNGRFGPNDGITREQLAVMLWRYAGSPAAAGGELHFSDAGKIGAHARDAMCWAVENGVMSGRGGGVLDPKGLATRAQAAQMLKNFLKNG